MPIVFTKHPDIVLNVLQEAGMKCQEGVQKIITDCPLNRFCSTQSDSFYGEICVKNLEEAFVIYPVVIGIIFLLLFIFFLRSRNKKK